MNKYAFMALSMSALLARPANGQIAFTTNNTALSGTYGDPSCVVDVNGDGLDDVIRFSGTQMFIAFQQSTGGFTQQSFGNATVSPNWSVAAGDLNGDGFADVLIGNGSANSFMWSGNNGTTYSETYFAPYIFSQRTNMVDFNNDGHLDAFSCHDVGLSKPYRNTGAGTVVEDQSLLQQVTTVGGNYSSIFTDLDNDGDLDLYISKCRSGAPVGDPQRINLHYRNNGNGTWTEIGLASGLRDGAQSWTTVIEDFNNDGFMDAFIVNHTDGNRLMMNNGDGTFTDQIVGSGIGVGLLGAWEGQGADFDNDGFVDIFSEVGGGMYRNNGNGTFTNINIQIKEGGIGDLNSDGWLDIHRGGSIFFNNGGTNHWFRVSLEGIFSNKDGIGARLWLYGDWGVQTREVRSGEGFSHMSSLTSHFGLGQATSIDSLVVNWPSGVRTVVYNPAIDQRLSVPEALCTTAPIQISAIGSTSFCPGSTVQLEAPAGFASYSWSNGATSASIQVGVAGNYSVTAFDGDGCAALSNSIAIQVIEDVPPTVSVLGPDEFCSGGSVELSSSSSSSPVWSNGATGTVVSVTESGNYSVTTAGQCGAVTSSSVEILVNPAATAPIADDVTIPTAGTAMLNAVGDNINWYLNETDVLPAGTGNMWETPFVSGQTTFWVDATAIYGGEQMNGGKPDNSGGGGIPSSGSHSFFTTWEPFTIEEVTVYAIGAGPRTVNLCNAAGVVLQSANFVLEEGTHVLTLNFDVPVGNDLSLRCPQHTLFRNSGGVSYPYPIGTMGELTTSGFGPSWYYYFYDWKVRTPQMECSSERVPVTVNVGTVGIDGTQDASSLVLYPVPANEELRIDGAMAGDQVSFFDAQGRKVLESSLTITGTATIPVTSLSPGAYLVQILGTERNIVREVIIVR